MKIIKLLITIILFFVTVAFPVFGQVAKCIVIDALNHKPVPYATVYSSKSGMGIHADEEGYFEWHTGISSDSIVVSSVGYKHQKIMIKSLKEDIVNSIEINQDLVELSEVIVRPGSKSLERIVGFFYNEPDKNRGMGPGGISENQIFVNYYPNTEQMEGYIKKLMFDIKGFDLSQKSSRARIRILSYNKSSGLPDRDLLRESIVVKITKFSPNILLNIEKYKIVFPTDGVFIGLEFICHNEFIYKKKSLSRQKTDCPRITTTKAENYREEGKSYYWTYHANRWIWACISDGSIFPGQSWHGRVFKFGAVISSFQ
ncbi:carboxypeptidase-like regulatory domain-containing protein [Larkinella punicea]|nr:carboxypeptidase-like regulatory domain-containing protein [Larkinella punicea]